MHIRPINVNGAFMSNNPKHIWMRKKKLGLLMFIKFPFYFILSSNHFFNK